MVSLRNAAHPIGGAGPSARVRQIDRTRPTTINMRMTNESSFVAKSERKCLTIAVIVGLQLSTIGGDIGFDRRLWHHGNAAMPPKRTIE
jgi:hypothetical protein